jgi:hypothetical protein
VKSKLPKYLHISGDPLSNKFAFWASSMPAISGNPKSGFISIDEHWIMGKPSTLAIIVMVAKAYEKVGSIGQNPMKCKVAVISTAADLLEQAGLRKHAKKLKSQKEHLASKMSLGDLAENLLSDAKSFAASLLDVYLVNDEEYQTELRDQLQAKLCGWISSEKSAEEPETKEMPSPRTTTKIVKDAAYAKIMENRNETKIVSSEEPERKEVLSTLSEFKDAVPAKIIGDSSFGEEFPPDAVTPPCSGLEGTTTPSSGEFAEGALTPPCPGLACVATPPSGEFPSGAFAQSPEWLELVMDLENRVREKLGGLTNAKQPDSEVAPSPPEFEETVSAKSPLPPGPAADACISKKMTPKVELAKDQDQLLVAAPMEAATSIRGVSGNPKEGLICIDGHWIMGKPSTLAIVMIVMKACDRVTSIGQDPMKCKMTVIAVAADLLEQAGLRKHAKKFRLQKVQLALKMTDRVFDVGSSLLSDAKSFAGLLLDIYLAKDEEHQTEFKEQFRMKLCGWVSPEVAESRELAPTPLKSKGAESMETTPPPQGPILPAGIVAPPPGLELPTGAVTKSTADQGYVKDRERTPQSGLATPASPFRGRGVGSRRRCV